MADHLSRRRKQMEIHARQKGGKFLEFHLVGMDEALEKY